jgi:phage shock protein PspC (stress-responsive transcriptional regulator)
MQVNRRLTRCRQNRVVAGVASGVAEFFGIDPTLVRVLWFVSIFFGGVSLLLYLGLAIIVPLEPLGANGHGEPAEGAAEPAGHRHGPGGGGRWVTFFGIALILLGSLALLAAVAPSIATWRYLWPVFIIGMGVVLVAGAMRRADAPAATVSAASPGEPTES